MSDRPASRRNPPPDALLYPSSSSTPGSGSQSYSVITLLTFLTFLAIFPYSNTLLNSFVYDDHSQIQNNPYILSFRYLGKIFSTSVWSFTSNQGSGNYYRPVMTLGYLICYRLFGMAPYGFHLANIVLHELVVCVLFLFSRRLFGGRGVAFCAAAVFALHPIHSESVAWVAAITDVEVTLFFLLTFWCFLELVQPLHSPDHQVARQLVMGASYGLALFSKEQAFTLPLLATIYEHFYRQDREKTGWALKLSRYALLWALASVYLLLRVVFLGGLGALARPGLKWLAAALSALALFGEYIFKLCWPVHQSMYYSFHESTSLLDIRVLGGAGALIVCAALFMVLWRRARVMSFALVWFVLTLGPVLNARWLAPNVFAERYLYLPSVGFSWLAGWGAVALWNKAAARNRLWRWAMIGAMSALAGLCINRIVSRNREWRNDEVLYQATLAAHPDAYPIRSNLGSVYWDRGDDRLAQEEWLEALKWAPDSPIILTNLGVACAKEKHYTDAVEYYERALRVQPKGVDPHLDLGIAFQEMGLSDRAEIEFRTAVNLSPLNFHARNRLGKIYLDTSRLKEAEEQFRLSIESAPNVVAYDALGDIYSRQGAPTLAESAFRSALALNSLDSHAYFGLGALYFAAGRQVEAANAYQAGLNIDATNVEARSALQKLTTHVAGANSSKP